MNENEEIKNEAENVEETQGDAVRDESLLPRVIGKPFGKDNQPSGAAKSAGRMKAKRNRELMQYILSRSWKANRMNREFHDKIIEMTGLTEQELDDLTYEGMLYLAQTIKAIKQGDTQAANLILERAFGKPIQKLEFEGSDTPPPINITIGENKEEIPPISESEND